MAASLRTSKSAGMVSKWRAGPFALLALALACGGRPPAPAQTSPPKPAPEEPNARAFALPEQGLYDVEAHVLADTCWSGRPTTLVDTRFVEVTTHAGQTFVYLHVDQMPDV